MLIYQNGLERGAACETMGKTVLWLKTMAKLPKVIYEQKIPIM